MTDQEATPEVRIAEASTSQPAQQARRGRSKARALRGNIPGRRAHEQARDSVKGGKAVARPITPFEVDTHGSWMTKYEMALILRYYLVLNLVQFHLPGPADVPTRPPPDLIVVYRDYFTRGLWLPLHPFIREVLLNLEVSLPQLNLNAY